MMDTPDTPDAGPDPDRVREADARLGDEARGPGQPQPDRVREAEARLEERPEDGVRRGPDPERTREARERLTDD